MKRPIETIFAADTEGPRFTPGFSPDVPPPRKRVVLCRHWETRNFCEMGANCGFAHGEHELGTFSGQQLQQPSFQENPFPAQTMMQMSASTGSSANLAGIEAHKARLAAAMAHMGSPASSDAGASAHQQRLAQAMAHMGVQTSSDANAGGFAQQVPQMMPETGGDDSYQTSEVESFLAEHGIDESAANDLRSCPPEVQRLVLDRGTLAGVTNPSRALIGRIKNARAQTGVKTQLCRHFQRSGFCQLGNSCGFAHGEQELGNVPLPNQGSGGYDSGGPPMFSPGVSQAAVAPSFTPGVSPGMAPEVPHYKKKVVLCRHWQTRNYCEHGENCNFAHGEHELRGKGSAYERQQRELQMQMQQQQQQQPQPNLNDNVLELAQAIAQQPGLLDNPVLAQALAQLTGQPQQQQGQQQAGIEGEGFA